MCIVLIDKGILTNSMTNIAEGVIYIHQRRVCIFDGPAGEHLMLLFWPGDEEDAITFFPRTMGTKIKIKIKTNHSG